MTLNEWIKYLACWLFFDPFKNINQSLIELPNDRFFKIII